MRGVFRRPPLPRRDSPRYENAMRNPYNLARSCHRILNFCRCAFSRAHVPERVEGPFVVSLHLNGFRSNCKLFSEFRAHVHAYKRSSNRVLVVLFALSRVLLSNISKPSFERNEFHEKLFFRPLIKIFREGKKKWIEFGLNSKNSSIENDRTDYFHPSRPDECPGMNARDACCTPAVKNRCPCKRMAR